MSSSIIPPVDELNQHTLLDVIMAGSSKVVEKTDPDGNTEYHTVPDTEAMWWRTQIVASPNLARFVLHLKELERLGEAADQHMPPERASVVKEGIRKVVTSYRTMIAAKSSESRLDANNMSQTLLDKISHSKSEHIFTAKSEAAKSLGSMFMGRRGDDQE